MHTPQEHYDLYMDVRSAILGQYFAVGVGYRANIISIRNDRHSHAGDDGDPRANARITQWDVVNHDRDNTLLWSTKLICALGAEYQLGNAAAEQMAYAAFVTFENLFKFSNGDSFDGYMIRSDPTTSDSWSTGLWAPYNEAFLLDAGTGDYTYCLPHSNPRHCPKRSDATIAALLSDQQLAEYNDNLGQYEQCRNWEPSADEMVGMLCCTTAAHELIPTASIRDIIQPQVQTLGNYLAENGYVLVRPASDLVYRGQTALVGFEYAFEQAFARITGTSFASRIDFVGALQKAGLWRVLRGPVEAEAVLIGLGAPFLLPLLGGIMAADPTGLVGAVLGSVVSVLSGAAPLSPSLAAAVPLMVPAMPRSIGLYNHRDVFDMQEKDREETAVLPNLLSAVPALLRLDALFDVYAALPAHTAENSKSFLPYIAMSSIAEPGHPVASAYLRAMAAHRLQSPDRSRTDVLDSCFASAVALLLGATEEEERLVALLDARYDLTRPLIAVDQGDVPASVDSAQPLDYLAGVSLAWLYAKRCADRGAPVRTPGFPVPPAAGMGWPAVSVPAEALRRVNNLRAAVGAADDQHDLDLFGDAVTQFKSDVPMPVVPSADEQAIVAERDVRVSDIDGDVDSGIVLKPGQQFEITATGTIVAPELFAGSSDANGWNNIVDDARFALHSGIDPGSARKYALLGRLNGYFFVGTHRARERYLYPVERKLYFRVNNDDHRKGAGNGAFEVHVTVWDDRPVQPGAVQVIDIVRGQELTPLARLGGAFLGDNIPEVDRLIRQENVGVLGAVTYTADGTDPAQVAGLAETIKTALAQRSFTDPPALWTALRWDGRGHKDETAAYQAADQVLQALHLPPGFELRPRVVDVPPAPNPCRLFLVSQVIR